MEDFSSLQLYYKIFFKLQFLSGFLIIILICTLVNRQSNVYIVASVDSDKDNIMYSHQPRKYYNAWALSHI